MTSCSEALGILRFEKKSSKLGFESRGRESIFGLASARLVGVYEMCRAFVEEIVSLSPHVEKP